MTKLINSEEVVINEVKSIIEESKKKVVSYVNGKKTTLNEEFIKKAKDYNNRFFQHQIHNNHPLQQACHLRKQLSLLRIV